LPFERVFLFVGYLCPTGIPQNTRNDCSGDALPGSGVPPWYIDTNHNDVGVMLSLCKGK
jgi:hypothetical protein